MVENTQARMNNFRPDEMASLLYGLSHLAASRHIHQQEEQQRWGSSGRAGLDHFK